MARLLYGTKQSAPDLFYLSGFAAPDPVFLLEIKSKRWLIVSVLEKGRADQESNESVTVISHEWLKAKTGQTKLIDGLTKWIKLNGTDRVSVPRDFPYGISCDLAERGILTDLIKGTVCPERLLKSPSEVESIRHAQQAAVSAMDAAIAQIQQSEIGETRALNFEGAPLTSELVRTTIRKRLLDFECTAEEVIVAGGAQGAQPHERGFGPLFAGDAIVMDIFPYHSRSGYWGDLTRTVCRGEASAELQAIYAAVLAGQERGLALTCAGVSGDAIHRAVEAELDAHGFKTDLTADVPCGFIHSTGHGVGLEIHESPRISRNAPVLQAGQMVTVEPGLYYPAIGGIRIEDTVLVTATGCEVLVPCEKKFQLS